MTTAGHGRGSLTEQRTPPGSIILRWALTPRWPPDDLDFGRHDAGLLAAGRRASVDDGEPPSRPPGSGRPHRPSRPRPRAPPIATSALRWASSRRRTGPPGTEPSGCRPWRPARRPASSPSSGATPSLPDRTSPTARTSSRRTASRCRRPTRSSSRPPGRCARRASRRPPVAAGLVLGRDLAASFANGHLAAGADVFEPGPAEPAINDEDGPMILDALETVTECRDSDDLTYGADAVKPVREAAFLRRCRRSGRVPRPTPPRRRTAIDRSRKRTENSWPFPNLARPMVLFVEIRSSRPGISRSSSSTTSSLSRPAARSAARRRSPSTSGRPAQSIASGQLRRPKDVGRHLAPHGGRDWRDRPPTS